MRRSLPSPLPRRLHVAALLLLTVIGCGPMRPQPGDLVPMQGRVTNEVLAADLATIDAWEQRRVSLLRNHGADLAFRTVVLARAGAWLVFARETYLAQPRAPEADEALAEARRLIESLSDPTRLASSQAAASALVAAAEKSNPVLWARLRELEASPDAATRVAFLAEPVIAQAGVVRLAPPDALRANAHTVHFALASDVLREPSAALLDGVAGVMSEHPDVSLVIEGHADPRGADTSNLWLSGRRAAGVRELLIGKGVDGNRVLVRMFGARRRDGTGTTALDYARDRRVQIRFVLPDGTELPVMNDASDLQIESQKLWTGALRPRLRRYVPEPGSTDVPPPEPVAAPKAKAKGRTRTRTAPRGTS
ncbi:MAG: OmpA family protein [Gemmatimonadota bacterium]|nr:OmpA family protein [Gemmatimonadota bacterium]